MDRHSAFRPDRFFWAGGPHLARTGWYYEAREGVQGPFGTRRSAEDHLNALKRTRSVIRMRDRGAQGHV